MNWGVFAVAGVMLVVIGIVAAVFGRSERDQPIESIGLGVTVVGGVLAVVGLLTPVLS